ncbi:phosphotransferase [Demequina pelophila]|uniref:phosphotransferase n=1 Tax=Demequina pelophila TaxID=1638984 RepID=UPI00078083C0|nr:phosphotransferase [Demequina pelophila]
MIRDSGPPAAHASIGADLVAELVRAQAPALAHLEVGERFDGWDMAVFRLGAEYAVRLPRVESAVRSLDRETGLMIALGRDWTFPHPRLVRRGEPQGPYPWPWAIVTWLPGTAADVAPLAASAGPALGRALAEIHAPAAPEAWFNPEQSLPLADRQHNLDWALGLLAEASGPGGERLDVQGAREVWARALAAPGPTERVWSHADPHGSNVLGIDGAFAGLIDWGKMAGCDRAVDLSFLYTALPAAGVGLAVAAYRDATACDDPGLEARLRGIAVTKCASWAVLDRPLNVAMAWRGFGELGLLA